MLQRSIRRNGVHANSRASFGYMCSPSMLSDTICKSTFKSLTNTNQMCLFFQKITISKRFVRETRQRNENIKVFLQNLNITNARSHHEKSDFNGNVLFAKKECYQSTVKYQIIKIAEKGKLNNTK